MKVALLTRLPSRQEFSIEREVRYQNAAVKPVTVIGF